MRFRVYVGGFGSPIRSEIAEALKLACSIYEPLKTLDLKPSFSVKYPKPEALELEPR